MFYLILDWDLILTQFNGILSGNFWWTFMSVSGASTHIMVGEVGEHMEWPDTPWELPSFTYQRWW
jgi:hypothetical protein